MIKKRQPKKTVTLEMSYYLYHKVNIGSLDDLSLKLSYFQEAFNLPKDNARKLFLRWLKGKI